MLESPDKDIKTVIITVFNMFKTLLIDMKVMKKDAN